MVKKSTFKFSECNFYCKCFTEFSKCAVLRVAHSIFYLGKIAFGYVCLLGQGRKRHIAQMANGANVSAEFGCVFHRLNYASDYALRLRVY